MTVNISKEENSQSWVQNYTPELVSIIVPVYNVEQYLQRAIRSVLSQDYQNIELVLVDDGSSDLSGNICDLAATEDSRVRVIHQRNGGPGSARNSGIRVAKGEYLAFCDGDDWMDPSMLSEMLQVLWKTNADIVACDYYIVSDEEKHPYHRIQKQELLTQHEALKEIIEDQKIRSYPWDKLYKRKVFSRVFYPENQYYEDVATTYKTFLNSKNIVLYPVPLYNYYQHKESILHAQGGNKSKVLRNDFDLFHIGIEREKIISPIYPDFKNQLRRINDFNALRVYNETIMFQEVHIQTRSFCQREVLFFIKKHYTEIMHNPLSSREHKARITMLMLFPQLYKLTQKLICKQRGNLS